MGGSVGSEVPHQRAPSGRSLDDPQSGTHQALHLGRAWRPHSAVVAARHVVQFGVDNSHPALGPTARLGSPHSLAETRSVGGQPCAARCHPTLNRSRLNSNPSQTDLPAFPKPGKGRRTRLAAAPQIGDPRRPSIVRVCQSSLSGLLQVLIAVKPCLVERGTACRGFAAGTDGYSAVEVFSDRVPCCRKPRFQSVQFRARILLEHWVSLLGQLALSRPC